MSVLNWVYISVAWTESHPQEENFMRSVYLGVVLATAIAMLASTGSAQKDAAAPYKVLKTVKVGGEGGFDYISADVENRLLVMPRSGAMGGLTLFNLDTLAPAGSI